MADKDTGVAEYILVHEAFLGGWVWGKVASILRWEKHEVYTPTVTGCGDRSHLLREGIDLHSYINDLTSFFNFDLAGDTGLHAGLNGWSCLELESGHLPMVSIPEKLTELLMAVGV
jgi:hypothetical protein